MKKYRSATLVPAALAASLVLAVPAHAQMSEAELITRINRLEAQVRQLTGTIEQLQYRNRELEQQLARAQGAGPPAAAPRGAIAPMQYPQQAAAPPAQPYPPQAYPPQQPYPPQANAAQEAYPPAPPPAGGRRNDAFDPNQNPNAAGAPRALGGPGTVAVPPPFDSAAEEQPNVGAPGGRQAGAPLDLGTLAEEAANGPPPPRTGPVRTIPGALPAPPPRNPSGIGATQMVMAPTNTPKDEYDLAYGYVLRKDYALAEDALRAFVKKFPNDRLTADADYWLGETLFQRQRYREAAETFLNVSTKHAASAKAPDSLLRLGQSLAALKEKDAACATFGEIARKYPRASANVKQSAEREQKRVGCL